MFNMMDNNGQPEIGSIATASGFTTILDVSGDPDHVTSPSGKSIGLWLDTPIVPYRTSGGNVVFICGAQTSYRYVVTGNNWTAANISKSPAGAVRNSNNTGIQQDYDHRSWIFGVYADGANIYAIGHHEWYNQRHTVDGYPGYNVLAQREWVTAPIWLKSTNNGNSASWSTKSYTPYMDTGIPNPQRLFLTPESWGLNSYETLYGFQHPSNIVKEGAYYYAFLDANKLSGPGASLLTIGVHLIRWSDLEDPTTTEFWNGTAWQARNIANWQGNNSTQQPYIFFPVSGYNPYVGGGRTDRMGQAIRYHAPTQQWLLFGYDGRKVPSLVYTRTKTLANPRFEENGITQIAYTGGGANSDYTGNSYIMVFDPNSTDQNFTDIGNSPLCVVSDNYILFKKQTLKINVIG